MHYTTLHCITLHYIALHCITLHYIALHCITLHYIALHCITLHYIAYIAYITYITYITYTTCHAIPYIHIHTLGYIIYNYIYICSYMRNCNLRLHLQMQFHVKITLKKLHISTYPYSWNYMFIPCFIPCLFHVFYNIFYTHLYFEDPQKPLLRSTPWLGAESSSVPRGQKSGPTSRRSSVDSKCWKCALFRCPMEPWNFMTFPSYWLGIIIPTDFHFFSPSAIENGWFTHWKWWSIEWLNVRHMKLVGGFKHDFYDFPYIGNSME